MTYNIITKQNQTAQKQFFVNISWQNGNNTCPVQQIWHLGHFVLIQHVLAIQSFLTFGHSALSSRLQLVQLLQINKFYTL